MVFLPGYKTAEKDGVQVCLQVTKKPCVDLHVGEPIIPTQNEIAYKESDRMHKEAYDVLQRMAGITPDMENYRTEQDSESYQKTM